MLQELALPFASSIADMESAELVRVAKDAGGSRVLEALLTRSKGAHKLRKAVFRKLQGSYASIASCPPGSFLVERGYTTAVSFPPPKIAGGEAKNPHDFLCWPLSMIGSNVFK